MDDETNGKAPSIFGRTKQNGKEITVCTALLALITINCQNQTDWIFLPLSCNKYVTLTVLSSMKPVSVFLTLLFALLAGQSYGQQLLKGVVSDENGISIPYAKLYVKNAAENRTIADASGYFEMRLFQGEYFLVITAEGFDNSEAYVTLSLIHI